MAERYFIGKMKIVKEINNRNNVFDFIDDCYNPRGGKCYHLSAHAIIGLGDEDKRICGVINTFPEDGAKQEENYTHAWVEFKAPDDQWYVYDPMVNFIVPRELWYKTCKPREIFSELTRCQILEKFLKPRFAVKLDEHNYVFKSVYSKNYKGFANEIDNKKNGYLFNALSRGIIKVSHYQSYFVDSFIVPKR